MSFAAPATGGGWTPADANGHLLVIEPSAHETGIHTSFGEKDAIRATVHDIDTGETVEDALIFPGGLIGALKPRVGQQVLARLSQGVAKPGQAPPWTLIDASADAAAVSRATAYLTAYQAGNYAAPAAPTAPVAAAAAPVAAGGEDPAIAAAKALLAQQGAL